MVRNSPCAMLMTPIWPKMIASPKAINNNTQKLLRPLKPCITRIAPKSDSEPISLITLGERIGLDQLRLIQHVELTICARLTDAELAPQVMVGMNLDVALGRGLQLDVGRCCHHLVDVEAAGLLDRGLPQPRAEVRGLSDVA